MRYKVKVQTLTNVHVGTGNEIEPYNYVVKEENGEKEFVRIDFFKFMKGLAEEELNDLLKLLDGNNNIFLAAFLEKHLDEKAILYSSKIEGKFDKNARFLEMPRDSFSQKPYIPGSSIKGAIRTAVYAKWYENTRDRNRIDNIRKGKELEARLSNHGYWNNQRRRFIFKMEQDPFRLLTIGDVKFKNEDQEITQSIYIHLSKGRDKSKEVYLESIKGSLNAKKEISSFTDFAVHDQVYRVRDSRQIPSKRLNLDFIVNSCNLYYFNRFRQRKNLYLKLAEEERIFQTDVRSLLGKIEEKFGEIKKFNEKHSDEKKCIIRFARFAQIENYLIKEDREERRTRRYHPSGYPFGFLMLHFIPES